MSIFKNYLPKTLKIKKATTLESQNGIHKGVYGKEFTLA